MREGEREKKYIKRGSQPYMYLRDRKEVRIHTEERIWTRGRRRRSTKEHKGRTDSNNLTEPNEAVRVAILLL